MEQNIRSFIRMLVDRSKATNNISEEAMTWTTMMTSGNGINKDILQAVFVKIMQRMQTVQDDKKDEVVNDIMKFLLGDSMSLRPESSAVPSNVSAPPTPAGNVPSATPGPTPSATPEASTGKKPDITKVKEDVVNYISEKLQAADKSLVLDRNILHNYAKSCGLELDGKTLNEVKAHIEKQFGNKGLTIIMKGSTIQFIKA